MAKSCVIFGDSGTYKSTNMGFAAKYLYEKHRKPIRLVTAENKEVLQPFINAGIIEFVEVGYDLKDPLPFLVKLGRGWWPDPLNPKVLIPPKDLVTLKEATCGYLVEGLTSLADVLMADERNKARKHAQEPVGVFSEDGFKFCAPAQAHYGFVQTTMLDRIIEFGNLPVDRVIFSAHEAKGEEADTRNAIRGPGLVGKAATDSIPRKVGTCIHFESYAEDKIVDKVAHTEVKVRAFFMSHPDPKFQQVMYKCKPRVPVDKIPELLKKWPGGFFEPSLIKGLDEYLRVEDELNESASSAIMEWKKALR